MIKKKIKICFVGATESKTKIISKFVNGNIISGLKTSVDLTRFCKIMSINKSDKNWLIAEITDVHNDKKILKNQNFLDSNNFSAFIHVFDYFDDNSFQSAIEMCNRLKMYYDFREKETKSKIPLLIFLCGDYPYFDSAKDKKIQTYYKSSLKKKGINQLGVNIDKDFFFMNIKDECNAKNIMEQLFNRILNEKKYFAETLKEKAIDMGDSLEEESEEEEIEEEEEEDDDDAEDEDDGQEADVITVNNKKKKKKKSEPKPVGMFDKFIGFFTGLCGGRNKKSVLKDVTTNKESEKDDEKKSKSFKSKANDLKSRKTILSEFTKFKDDNSNSSNIVGEGSSDEDENENEGEEEDDEEGEEEEDEEGEEEEDEEEEDEDEEGEDEEEEDEEEEGEEIEDIEEDEIEENEKNEISSNITRRPKIGRIPKGSIISIQTAITGVSINTKKSKRKKKSGASINTSLKKQKSINSKKSLNLKTISGKKSITSNNINDVQDKKGILKKNEAKEKGRVKFADQELKIEKASTKKPENQKVISTGKDIKSSKVNKPSSFKKPNPPTEDVKKKVVKISIPKQS